MGYSYAAKAGLVLEALIERLKSKGDPVETTNGFSKAGIGYFYELGRENGDGSISGTVWRMKGPMAYKAGSLKINAEGKIVRFPASTAEDRAKAEIKGLAEYDKRFSKPLIEYHLS